MPRLLLLLQCGLPPTTALWHLLRCLPHEGCLLSDARTVQLDPRFPLWLDVEELEATAVRRTPDGCAGLVRLEYRVLVVPNCHR
jgi:hypothetical protein